MKRLVKCFVVLALLIGNYAYATTYTYTGQNYTEVSGAYTTDMRITGTFTTSSPIPPNSVDFNIEPILTGWSFNDGLQSFNDTNSKFVLKSVSTDGLGNIIRNWITLFSPSKVRNVGDVFSEMELLWAQGVFTNRDSVCTGLNSVGYCNRYNVFEEGHVGLDGIWVTAHECDPGAEAATYTYTGEYFTTATDPYTTDMRVTGTLVTCSPIPPNSVDFHISEILTSWSFNDGAQTITSADGEFSPNFPPLVTTDEQGVIIDSYLVVFSSPISTTIDATDDYIVVAFRISLSAIDIVCTSVTDGFCDLWRKPESNFAQADSYGVWVTVDKAAIFKDSFEE